MRRISTIVFAVFLIATIAVAAGYGQISPRASTGSACSTGLSVLDRVGLCECENLLNCAEKLCSIAYKWRATYPSKDFKQSRRKMGANRAYYEETIAQARGAINAATDAIARRINTNGQGIPIVVFNSLSWTRTDTVSISSPFPGEEVSVAVKDAAGRTYPARSLGDQLFFTARDVLAMGYKVFWAIKTSEPAPTGIKVDKTTIENQFFRVTIDPDKGFISSIFDKISSREIVPKGSALGLLQIAPSPPRAGACPEQGRREGWGEGGLTGNTEAVVLDSGPAKATITFDHEHGGSLFTQIVTVNDGVPRIDMQITADWHEPDAYLNCAFPVMLNNAKATAVAPTWTDLSEQNYGVSLLDSCKSNFDVKGNTMRALLLNASSSQGIYEFSASIYPHKGDWRPGGTIRRAFEINEPLVAVAASRHTGKLPVSRSFISVLEPNVIVAAFKQADDERSFILRLKETQGRPSKATININLPYQFYIETDNKERPIGKKQFIKEGKITVNMGKNEAKTLKLLRS